MNKRKVILNAFLSWLMFFFPIILPCISQGLGYADERGILGAL